MSDAVDAEALEKRVMELRVLDPDTGWKRIQAQLKEEGIVVSENRLKKAMKSAPPASGGVGGGDWGAMEGVERRKADVGRGHGLFATAGVKAGEALFAVRPALCVVFEHTTNSVCAFCLCAAPTGGKAERIRRKLTPRENGTFGVVFDDTPEGVVVTCVDSDSPNRCAVACGDVVALIHPAAESPKSAASLVEAMKANSGGLEVGLSRSPFSSCRTCQRAGVCERCADMGAWGWHARECELFSKLPEPARRGDTSVIRFLLRWRVTLELGPWFGSAGGETLQMVDKLQGNVVAVTQVKQLALVTGVPEETVAKLMFQIRTNAVEVDVGGKAACALSAWVGYTNHSCEPSAAVSVGRDGRVTMVALRAIKAGEEVSISYINGATALEERQEVLKEHYGFSCKCPKCLRESGGQVKSRLQDKLEKKKGGDGAAVEHLSSEEFARREKAANEAMAALIMEDAADKGKKKKKK